MTMSFHKKSKQAFSFAIVVLGCCCMRFLLFGGETYCRWCPDIDTTFAPGFKKENFLQISMGMDSETVISLVGVPFAKQTPEPDAELEIWYYSHDGALGRWGDKAWISYEVIFRNGKVVSNASKIYYD